MFRAYTVRMLFQDLRFGLRTALKNKGVTSLAVICLAIGIGLNTMMFSVTDGVLIQQFNGAAAGQTVFHLHFHIIPIKEGVPLKPHAGSMADQAALAATAEKIRRMLQRS